MNTSQRTRHANSAIFTGTLFVLACFLWQPSAARAQWATNGTNINNTNTGNVGVGTSSPAATLDVRSQTAGAPGVIGASNAGNSSFLSMWSGTGTNTPAFIYPSGQSLRFGNGDYVGAVSYAERMRIDPSGNVGIGTATPSNVVTVQKDQPYDPAVGVSSMTQVQVRNDHGSGFASFSLWSGGERGRVQFNAADPNVFLTSRGNIPLYLGTNDTIRMTVNGTSGNVGIGTTNPGRPLVVTADASGVPLRVYRNVNHIGWGTGIDWAFNNSAGNVIDYAYVNSTVVTNTAGAENGTLGFFTITSGTLTQQAIIDQNGNVGIGTTAPTSKLHVIGDITVTGNINAKYQDVAEWVPSTQKLQAGTVVTLDPERANHVLASASAYDTAVAGVVSARPGIALGEAGEGKVLVATTGRVKVRVDATRSPIKIGDLLVTSDVAGVAMRSEPVTVGGRRMHAPGTIIGKALEPLERGAGEILVLLSLQ